MSLMIIFMKSISLVELQNIIETIHVLVGAQLQEVIPHDRGLALGLHHRGRLTYLLLDLSLAHPGIFLFDAIPFWVKSLRPKPMSLFLNSHGKNLQLQELQLDKELGRVVNLKFANSTQVCELQCVLIPKQANLLVQAYETEHPKKTLKKISWAKPRMLAALPTDYETVSARAFEDIHEEWLRTFGGSSASNKINKDPEAEWEKSKNQKIIKKKKALEEIEKDANSQKADQWQQLGELLKIQTLSELPKEWEIWIDSKLNLKDNRERAFQKAKQVRLKRTGQLERIEILKKEIAELENSKFDPHQQRLKASKNKMDLMKTSEASGRTRKLASGAVAYMGKSAQDNLRILRAAKAWDFWLHLRDYPGAHAVIHREKNQIISETELREIALWVADETLSKKTLALGQSLNIILVECRFVRPIKGDRHGRVNFHGERNLVVSYQKT